MTLPNIKWGLLYGVILCNARAMGEFGAVSVVSGHIRGQTNTLPLHVEILYNEYNFAAAFAVASLLDPAGPGHAGPQDAGRMAATARRGRRGGHGRCHRKERGMSIEVRNLRKAFGTFTALDDLSLDVPGGELVALLGPSGSGKTTLLRIIAGLEPADAGTIHFHGEDATEQPVRERQVGFVFQHYALFRHMSVFENVAFGLRVRPRQARPSEAEIRETVHGLLQLVQLDVLAERRPSAAVGGPAPARGPGTGPGREAEGAAARRAVRRAGREGAQGAAALAPPSARRNARHQRLRHPRSGGGARGGRSRRVMNQGRIEQSGTPEEVYEHPATPFVYGFLGNVNLFHGRIHQGRVDIGENQLAAPEWAHASDQAGIAYVRTYDVKLSPEASGVSSMEAIIRHVRAFGPVVRLEVDLVEGGRTIEAHVPRDRFDGLGLARGQRVYVSPTRVRVFAQPS